MRTEADYRALWGALSGAAKDTLVCLCKHGPTWDGDVPSKTGRDELLEKGLTSKIVMGDCWRKVAWRRPAKITNPCSEKEEGYQAATYLGAAVYKYGFTEPRKDIVRKLIGDPSLVRP